MYPNNPSMLSVEGLVFCKIVEVDGDLGLSKTAKS